MLYFFFVQEDRKVPGILVLAERGTVILRAGNHIQKPGLKQKSQGTSARYEQPQPPKGVSGYDPEDKDMRGVFMARGPGEQLFNKFFLI